mgnify:CR=1 FL=1
MTQDTLANRMMTWTRGNSNAAMLCLDLWHVVQTWDDLYDNDEVTKDDINETFRRLIYNIPTNPFYAEHAHELAPLIHNMMIQWQIANTFEVDQKSGDLNKAWMLRASIYQIWVYIAGLAVDPQWASVVGPDVWRTYGETLEKFIEEMTNA